MPTLQWLNRDDALKAADAVPYRLLEEDASLSAGDTDTENMLIQGDNLAALKSLLPIYAGRVKCIYIDPPYNTHSAFEHYDDNVEHSTWLSMMYGRLELLRDLLSEDGSIWVSIDDNEGHYLKVIMDEVFGRKNFVANVVWQKRTSPDMRATVGAGHDHIIVFSRKFSGFKNNVNKLPKTEKQKKAYKNPDNDPRGRWVSSDYCAQGFRPNQMYEIVTPGGSKYIPPEGVCWKNIESIFLELVADNRIWFGKNGNAMPRRKTFLKESNGNTAWTWWPNEEAGHNQEAKKEINSLFGVVNKFDTPKPERLLKQIITIATNPGDIVLDSFLGSGTTAAVAHKMGRKYIGIEMGDHAVTHCVPRLQKVIDGEQGGISESVEWKGGGGFRFFRLGSPVFSEDGAIHPDIHFSTLAAHVWFSETRISWTGKPDSPLLGIHDGTAYYLLFNGILGDRRTQSGNVLNAPVFRQLPTHDGPKIIYGEWSQWQADRLRRENIIFKQIPYDVRVR